MGSVEPESYWGPSLLDGESRYFRCLEPKQKEPRLCSHPVTPLPSTNLHPLSGPQRSLLRSYLSTNTAFCGLSPQGIALQFMGYFFRPMRSGALLTFKQTNKQKRVARPCVELLSTQLCWLRDKAQEIGNNLKSAAFLNVLGFVWSVLYIQSLWKKVWEGTKAGRSLLTCSASNRGESCSLLSGNVCPACTTFPLIWRFIPTSLSDTFWHHLSWNLSLSLTHLCHMDVAFPSLFLHTLPSQGWEILLA